MSSREKKKRKRKREPSPTPTSQSTTSTPQSNPIPSLPYDLLLICVARVSRMYYPTLSLVSKSFRSLIASPELYKTRSLLGVTESCLYACLQSLGDSNSSIWFTLCRKPRSNRYALARVQIPNSPRVRFSSVVAVGSNIYNIVNSAFHDSFSRVSILDCTSHTWSEAPSLPVELSILSASVLDQKIYVAGSYIGVDSSRKNSFQVFDTKTKTWDPFLPSETEDYGFIMKKTASFDGKFHVINNKEVVAYEPNEGKWDMVENRMGCCMVSDSYCVIGNVLYSASDGLFKWYDTDVRKWRDLAGLEGLPKITRVNGIRLGDYGGKMLVFWDQVFWPCYFKTIRCAEIALERRNTSEICGKVVSLDHLLNIGTSYFLEKDFDDKIRAENRRKTILWRKLLRQRLCRYL